MLPRSRVRDLRRWMKEGIESKTEGNTLRSAYVPKFEGDFELMAPLLDPSMARKWLRNLGESSDRAKLKDFWEKQLLSLQREVKDAFQPLAYMLGVMPENSDAEMPVQTAIRLLGHVFSRITKMRRSNAMRHCAPKFSTMLIDNRLFSSRDYRNLFGNKFIDALEKEAIADAKMDQIGRYGGPSNSRGGNTHFRKGGSNSGSGANFKSNGNWNFNKPHSSNRNKSGGQQLPALLIITIPVTSQHRKFLRFIWDGVVYQYGWGSVCDGVTARGPWPLADQSRHINELEPGITVDIGSKRLDAIHRGIQTSPGCVAHGGGSFFGGVEQTIAEVCFLATTAERDSRERLLPQLVTPELLRVPPIRNDSEMSDKDKEGESCCHFGLPALVVSAVVPSFVGNGNGHSESVQLTPDPPSFELPRATPTHSIEKIPPSRMEIIRGRLEKRGLPPSVVRLLLASSRGSTLSTYQSAWNVSRSLV
ncbi:LOW QUALITY PROTEIN: uncharacterized protein LOC116930478 [Daphnia magna]|uniref:LOW QUALITY PROTEIN: uncharacterized protein LOC116930478 n=1 Tax=Daphnia magna TaxID=35525 RepID=UPI001E1BD0B1|nr:LOW QUALITY PROTEIN: uncharacterized protein LOC116930478 [Daphnia magna]